MGCVGGKKKGIRVSDSCESAAQLTTSLTKKSKKVFRKGKEQNFDIKIVPQGCSNVFYSYKGQQYYIEKKKKLTQK